MFDSSRSMALSKQYFTVLQLLRTARQQIDVNFAEWKVFCDNAAGKEYHLEIFLFLGNLAPHGVAREKWFECWQAQIDKVTELLKAQIEQLEGRIDRKTEEVESLRDGVRLTTVSFCICFFNPQIYNDTDKDCLVIECNITPRGDERNGSNRAIYVFTAVTIIYTPLAFMAVCTSTSLIRTLLTGPAGTMGIAHPEQNSSW